MEKIEDIEIIIEKCIDILEFQCDFYKMKPSEFIKALDKVINEIKKSLITDEQYEERIKEKDNGKK